MREKLDEMGMLFDEAEEMTGREICLSLAAAFLLGLVLGMIFSPRKRVTIGSNNGNNSNNAGMDEWEEDWEEE